MKCADWVLLSPAILLLSCAKPVEVPNIAEAEPQVRAAPEPVEFQLGPGDRISIDVWRHEDLDMDVTISPDGSITYPLVGRVQAAGMTYPELAQTLASAIAEYYEDPQVSVNIVELNSQKIFILGDGVTSPIVLQLEDEMSILEALTRAGGLNTTARTRNVLLVRGGLDDPELYTVDVQSIYTEGRMDQMIYMQEGDIVVVPAKTITNVANYFREVSGIVAPFVSGSAIYRNISTGAGPDASVE